MRTICSDHNVLCSAGGCVLLCSTAVRVYRCFCCFCCGVVVFLSAADLSNSNSAATRQHASSAKQRLQTEIKLQQISGHPEKGHENRAKTPKIARREPLRGNVPRFPVIPAQFSAVILSDQVLCSRLAKISLKGKDVHEVGINLHVRNQ